MPADIPADTVKECIDTMDWLEDRHLLATVQPEENQEKEQQEEDEMYPDPGLLSYCDEFCSQEDSVSKVCKGWRRGILRLPGAAAQAFGIYPNSFTTQHAPCTRV